MAEISRRAMLAGVVGAIAAGAAAALGLSRAMTPRDNAGEEIGMVTLYTFGDSVLDCEHYNEYGVTPGELLVRNNDQLFPEFKGRDLQSQGQARLEHRARDGATVRGLPSQVQGLQAPKEGRALAIISVGGNDLLQGLVTDRNGRGVEEFGRRLEEFVRALPIRPIYLANVYDPSFGNDADNFLGVDPALARRNHGLVNHQIAQAAARHGAMVDLHAHFLKGDPSWYTRTIEPSLRGASEVRAAFLDYVLGAGERGPLTALTP